MSVIRVERRERFVTVDKRTADDTGLSWKARGLLLYLLGKPADWRISEHALALQAPDGRAALRSGLAELDAAGYMRREKVRMPNGTIAWETTVYERPLSEIEHPGPIIDPGEHAEKPRSENRPGLKTEYEVTTPTETSTSRALSEIGAPPENQQSPLIDATATFDDFWDVYPNRRAKPAALKAWKSALKRGADPQHIVDGAQLYANDPNRADAFTAHPATWLNQDRWDDPPLPTHLDPRAQQREDAYRRLAAKGGIVDGNQRRSIGPR